MSVSTGATYNKCTIQEFNFYFQSHFAMLINSEFDASIDHMSKQMIYSTTMTDAAYIYYFLPSYLLSLMLLQSKLILVIFLQRNVTENILTDFQGKINTDWLRY